MADSAEDPKIDDSQKAESSEPEIVQSDVNELMADEESVVVLAEEEESVVVLAEEEEESVVVLAEDPIGEMELEEVKEENSGEKETADAESKKEDEMEADEYLEMSVDADVIDDIAGGDDEDGKEIHEGDGEHEEMKDDEDEEEEEDEEEPDDSDTAGNQDPNVMPQVNVAVLAQRKWQVKVYPLKPSDFVNGQISRVFKHARESLLYLLCPGRNARGKGEMYISSVNQAVRCVHSLMRLEYFYPEINVEIIKKNDEGEVEEKAYLRFDSKLTQMLTTRPYRKTAQGRKRDRLIGSVFVKNLPPGTTKDTLRVMFPFAQEVNYNPEKFKDCTARLVLHYRSHVIPCLKAFAKIELGGNVLELHPLTKRKRTRTGDDNIDKDVPDAKQRKSEEPKKEDTPKKNEVQKVKAKQPPVEKKDVIEKEPVTEVKPKAEPKPAESKDKTDNKNQQDAKSTQNKRRRRPPGNRRNVAGAQTKEQNKDHGPNRSTLVGGKERSAPTSYGGNRGGKSPIRANRGRQQDRLPASSPRNYRDDRRREFKTAARRYNRNPRPRGSAGGGGGSIQGQGSMGRSSYDYGASSGLGMRAPMTASDASLAINAEATKEMVLLQNQLSMAIKNQLTMLNQTQLAVEQAKRGASSIGLGSDMHSSLPTRHSPKAQGAGVGGSRRSLDQYRPATSLDDSMDRYDNRGTRQRNKRRGGGAAAGGGGGGGIRGYGKRGGGGGGGAGTGSGISNYTKRGGAGSSVSNYTKRGGAGSGISNYTKRGNSGSGISNYTKRGGAGSGNSNYAKRGGAAAGISNYAKRSGGSYRDEVEDWDADMSSSQFNDPYSQPQDYVYERDLTSFGSQVRSSYIMDNSYSGYY